MSFRVLLCDDEIHILRAAEFKLKRAGYDVVCAHDGEQAWERIQDAPPDMLITDLQMPRLNGFGLVGRLRECEATKDIPVVMITAKGYELTRDDSQRLHIRAVLAKPFSPRAVLELVKEHLGEPEAAYALAD